MTKTANMTINIDPVVKADVEAICARYGMSLADAVSAFFRTTHRLGGFPFDLDGCRVPNDESIAAFEEIEEMIKGPSKGKVYTDIDQMMEELLSQCME